MEIYFRWKRTQTTNPAKLPIDKKAPDVYPIKDPTIVLGENHGDMGYKTEFYSVRPSID